MRKTIKIITGIICASLAISIGLRGVDNAKAESGSWIGTGGGSSSSSGGGTGANCNESRSNYLYREDCAGVSWIYYRAVNDAGDNDVTFALFTKLGSSGRNSQVNIPSICSNGGNGGFWHYGVNVQATSGDYFMDFSSWNKHDLYATSKYSWGHWTTVNDQLASWAPYSKPGQAGYETGRWTSYNWNVGSLNQDLIKGGVVYYTADHTSSGGKFGEVLVDYKKAAAAAGISGASSIPNDVYAFCYWEGIGTTSRFSRSTTKARERSADTDIVSEDKKVEVSITASTSELVPVEFTHRLYATKETSGISYTVSKSVRVISGSSTYTNNVKAGSKINESGTVNLTDNIGTYYTGYKVYDGVGNGYVALDSYELTFPKEGEYEFCETISASKDSDNFPKTTACAKIKVQKINTSYYANSNVAAQGGSDGGWNTTGIVASGETSASETNVPVGEQRSLVFSHNIYSEKAINNVDWVLTRGSITGNGYQLVSQTTCGNSGKANFTVKDGNSYGYFVGDPVSWPRRCSVFVK